MRIASQNQPYKQVHNNYLYKSPTINFSSNISRHTSKDIVKVFNDYCVGVCSKPEAQSKMLAITPEMKSLFDIKQKGGHEFSVGQHSFEVLFALPKVPDPLVHLKSEGRKFEPLIKSLTQDERESAILTAKYHDCAKEAPVLKKSNAIKDNIKILEEHGCNFFDVTSELDKLSKSPNSEIITLDHLHQKRSADTAMKYLDRLGVKDEKKEMIGRLIQAHTTLSDIDFHGENGEGVFRPDIVDRQKKLLKQLIHNPQELKLLYIQSASDIIGLKSPERTAFNKKTQNSMAQTYVNLHKELFGKDLL